MMKKSFTTLLVSLLAVLLMAGTAMAASATTITSEAQQEAVDAVTGPAFGVNSPTAGQKISQQRSRSYSGPGAEGYYLFEGTWYKKGADAGEHKLSGYCPSAKYGRATASGKTAAADRTIAFSSWLPLGTVVIIEGCDGPYPAEFNGVYVVEDRGDTHIEDEEWVDIFFDTHAEACHVTDAGWNYGHVWVAEPVDR